MKAETKLPKNELACTELEKRPFKAPRRRRNSVGMEDPFTGTCRKHLSVELDWQNEWLQ